MRMQKFIHRWQKTIFGSIVAVIALSMVVTAPTGDEREEKIVGRLFQTVEVTEDEYRAARPEAFLYQKWHQPQSEFPRDGTAEQKKVVWEYLALLHEARRQQLTVGPEEVKRRVEDYLYSQFRQRVTFDLYKLIVNRFFQMEIEDFERDIPKVLLTDKLVDLLAQSEFPDCKASMEELLQEKLRARVRVAAFDPARFEGTVIPVGGSAVVSRFEEKKRGTKTEEKVALEYVQAAMEDYQDLAPQPTDEEIRQYHKDHPKEFPRTTAGGASSASGEEYRTVEEAWSDVFDKVKESKLRALAYEAIGKFRQALGEEVGRIKDNWKDMNLEKLVEKLRGEGLRLRYGKTALFPSKFADDVEKSEGFGSGTGLVRWAFSKSTALYDFTRETIRTDKGYLLLQLRERVEGGAEDLTQTAEDWLRREISDEKKNELCLERARRIQGIVESGGWSAVPATEGIQPETSGYFSLSGFDSLGLRDSSLDSVLRSQIRPLAESGASSVGKCVTFPGSYVSQDQDKKGWAYLVSLEDVVVDSTAGLEEEFKSRYGAAVSSHRQDRQLRDRIVKDVVAVAALEEVSSGS